MKNSNEELSVRTNFYLSKILHQRLRKCVEHGKKTGQIKSMSRLVNNLLEDFVENYERNNLTGKLERENLKDNNQLFSEDDITADFVNSFIKRYRIQKKEFASWCEIQPGTLRFFLNGRKPTKYMKTMIHRGIIRFLEHEAQAEPLKLNVRR